MSHADLDLEDMIRGLDDIRVSPMLDSTPGFLTLNEGYTLMHFASVGRSHAAVVEIGSFMGKSTCWLAAGCRRRGFGSVVAVDHFRGSPEHQAGGQQETQEVVSGQGTRAVFDAHIAAYGMTDIVRVRVTNSTDTGGWHEPIRMLFIDGDHSYAATAADFAAWRPYVEPGGLICFHDYENPQYLDGVTRFVQEQIGPHYPFVIKVDSLAVFRMPA
jgi:predicted O-methyltransferase YrrM